MSGATLSLRLKALPELSLQVQKCEELLRLHSAEQLLPELEELLEQAHQGEALAQAASLPLCLSLARQRDTAPIWALQQAARRQEGWLQRVLESGAEPELELPARPPQLFGGRELSLGERKSLARRPSPRQIELLLKDSSALVLAQLLESPRLPSSAAMKLAASRPLHPEAARALLGSYRFLAQTPIRSALCLNPGFAERLALPLVLTLPSPALWELQQSQTLPERRRELARRLLRRSRLPGEAQRQLSASSSTTSTPRLLSS